MGLYDDAYARAMKGAVQKVGRQARATGNIVPKAAKHAAGQPLVPKKPSQPKKKS